jgi:NADPH:quinone reductase
VDRGDRHPNPAGRVVAAPSIFEVYVHGQPAGQVGAGSEVQLPLLRLMQRRVRIQGTVLRARPIEQKAEVVRAFEREVLPTLTAGAVKPVLDATYPAAEVAAAFDHLEGSGKVGKVLLDFGA